jgi:DHA2 family methylenomycin A resistance protein-like MFS transporter
MSLGFAVVQLDVTIVNVALKTIGSSFGGGIAGLQWVVNAYTVVFASLILTSGALGDRLGAKRLFVGGFTLFVVASMACGAAPSLLILIGDKRRSKTRPIHRKKLFPQKEVLPDPDVGQ